MSTYLTEIDTEAPQAASTAALATQAPAGNVGDPGPAGMDERIASALTDDAVRSDAVAALLVEVEAGANAADLVAKGARDAAMFPLLSRAEVNHARQEMVDSEFDRDRLRVAAQKLATRLVELKAAENSAALRGEHQALTGERDRLVAELLGMTDTLVQIGKLALAIDACEREIKRWNSARRQNACRLCQAGFERRPTAHTRGIVRRCPCDGCSCRDGYVAAAAVTAIAEATSGLKGSIERVQSP